MKRRLGVLLGPERHDYVLNHVVNRIPLVEQRMRIYDALGVRLADRRTTMIMLGARVFAPRLLRIGAHTIIGRATLDARGTITIGSNVNIGSDSAFQTGKHLVDSSTFEAEFLPIVVEDRAWVAERAFVLAGVTIGEGAVVAAGSVVTADVAPYSVVGGVPARHLRQRSRDLSYELQYRGDWI